MPLGKALWRNAGAGPGAALPHGGVAAAGAVAAGSACGRWAGCWPAVIPTWSGLSALARRQSWLTAKICFLDRAGQIFKMWHVVHRPFSYAFLLLLAIHIGMAVWMGFL